ncbi:hypothetical protein ACFQJC_17440 [Haloferax namakaokahaiae]|uniref:Phospholipase D-like domain-containing protein n=1 Tax=Haloferax namakaokahaiae TaxID=1748331 RepID=A0ABD5ZJJ5_9EURY
MPEDILGVSEELRTQSPERLWGISTESVYSALAAEATGESVHERLGPHIRAETLRTNDERDQEHVVEMHQWLLDELGLVNGEEVTLLGMVVLSSKEPQPLIRSIAVSQFQSAEMVLRSCVDVDENIPRRELDSLLADEWQESVLAPLLGSLGFMTIYPDSVDLEIERIDSSLTAQQSTSSGKTIAEAYRRVLPHIVDVTDEQSLDDLVSGLTGTKLNEKESTVGVAARLASLPSVLVEEDQIAEVVSEQRREYEEEFDTIRSLLTPSTGHEVARVETEQPIGIDDIPESEALDADTRDTLLNIVATVVAHPDLRTLDVTFVTKRGVTPYTLYQILSSTSGVECEVGDGVIEFESVPEVVEGDDLREEYITHLIERCSTLKSRIDTLSNVSVSIPPEPVAAESVVTRDYESLRDGDVAPAYFTYTLIDPDALGEKKMNDYVGKSRGLGQERARLRRWHGNRPSGLRSYTEMTDRLFSLGLEREIEDKVLRIMTPFDDDTFNEYVAQIRRLLTHGFEFRLLTRHTKDSWEWKRLQRNLLSEIKEHRDLVTLRTYSRFKEHQRVTADMDFRKIGELGIHGKLQTVGAPEEGAALLGSANFMENSYDWNPECGVYTERTQFVEAAIEFFDIVWDISEADELSIERLQDIPDRKLVPTYYTQG